jgi:Peptidase C10 family/Sulfatase-modifying factor enzyme 1/Spi protease inhibitor
LKRVSFLIAVIVLLCASSSFSKPIDKDKALKAAKTFLVVRYPAHDQNPIRTITSRGRSALRAKEVLPLMVSDKLVGYVVNLEPSGFVVFSADDEAPPVKIYSNSGSFEQLPDGMKRVVELELLEDSTTITSNKIRTNTFLLKSKRFAEHWSALTSDVNQDSIETFQTDSEGTTLLTTTWNQYDPYNYYAPAASSGSGGRAYTGCVATALAQILRYHSFPPAVTCNHTYTDNLGLCRGTHSISDAGMGAYNWVNMPSSISTSSTDGQKQAIGQLMYHCGVALESDYEGDPNGTGAYPTDVPSALQTYFSYTSDGLQFKDDYTDAQWYAKIQSDIDNDKPIFYAMTYDDFSHGHAVVCDGYRNGNEIHLNLGWTDIGWTTWYNMDNVSARGYTWTFHEVVFNVTPNAAQSQNKTLTITSLNPSINVPISVSPNDTTGMNSGATPFTRTYAAGTAVTLTPPLSINGIYFQKWQKDGADFLGNTILSTTVTMDTSHTMTVIYPALDTTPDQFTFFAQTEVPLNTTVTSNTITVSGINSATPISITGGTYSIQYGTYTNAPGTVTNGASVSVRQTSSGNYLSVTNATLTIGGVNGTFSVTTTSASPINVDLNGDGTVDVRDLAMLADQWLQPPGTPSADFMPDGMVNFLDFAVFAQHWLEIASTGMTWVTINDPGIGGGHEGFNGQMSKYDTTNAQYCQFLNAAQSTGDIIVSGNSVIGASGSNSGADFVGQYYYYIGFAGWTHDGATNGGASRIHYSGGVFTVDSGFENHPVSVVTWYGATAFCNYYGYRLPTEWEWQAVADYDGSYTYGCGTTINNSMANYAGSIHPNGTTAVGAFGMYGYGMCDMVGNVWEWTSSLYSGSYVLRGGGWSDGICNVWSKRAGYYPDDASCDVGFRVCR